MFNALLYTLAQICLNSFAKAQNGEFRRARLQDIEDFFEENHDLPKNDENLIRIKEVLEIMDHNFQETAAYISSRAVAVTAYLFVEDLFKNQKRALIPLFAEFYFTLLKDIEINMRLLSGFEKPLNTSVMEEFQKYVLQASVEAYSIKRRHTFLEKAFDIYQANKK